MLPSSSLFTADFVPLQYLAWRHNTQHNETQHNDAPHNDEPHNDTQHIDTQHSNKKATLIII
jgi:hypothetical protein